MAASALANPAAATPTKNNYAILAIIAGVGAAYGAYEYRQELAGVLSRLRPKRPK